jgi:hypothetical protein
MTDPQDEANFPDEDPWMGPSEWFRYRCRSCKHADWVEDIGVDAFPPSEPGGFPILLCPECGGDFVCDTSEPPKRSKSRPD